MRAKAKKVVEPARISAPASDQMVTAAELGEYLGATARSVRNYADSGEVVRAPAKARYWLKASCAKYCEGLRLAATRRGDASSSATLTAERARLARAQASAAEAKAAVLQGSLLDAVAVEREWSDILRGVRAGMLSVPSRLGALLPHLSQSDVGVIDSEIRERLTELGNGT